MSFRWDEVNLTDLMIPKTGTTWRESQYRHHGCQGDNRLVDKHHIPRKDKLAGEFVVTFIRHPVTWLQSRYYMGSIAGPGCPITALFKEVGGDRLSFDEMVTAYLDIMPGRISEYFLEVVSKCQFVGYFEKMAFDMNRLLIILGCDVDKAYLYGKPPVNKTDHKVRTDRKWASGCTYKGGLWTKVIEAEAELIKRYY